MATTTAIIRFSGRVTQVITDRLEIGIDQQGTLIKNGRSRFKNGTTEYLFVADGDIAYSTKGKIADMVKFR